jgi:hypothetical protein
VNLLHDQLRTDPQEFYAREINCGCETFGDGGIKVWIGDIMNGHHSETMFSRENMGDAGQWLVDETARLFPKAFQ